MANKKISELPYINVSKISGNTLVPLVTYFSATTGDTVHTYVDDFQTYLISGLTGQTDVFVTGGTYSAGTITITNNTGGTFNITGLTTGSTTTIGGDYLPLSGGTVTGDTIFNQGLSASTISATTYLNLPITTDVFVTGGTYSNGDATFTNNTGGTFNVTGFYTGETSYVNSLTTGVGLSADTTTGDITIINTDPDQIVTISGGTGITTGGTYPNFTITNSAPDQTVTLSEGTNISVTGSYPNFTIDVTGLTDNDVFITGFTYDDNNTFTISKNSGSSLNATINLVSGLTVNGDLSVTGNTNLNNVSATTISATTYQNLPLGIYGTGLTFNTGNYDLTLDGQNGTLDTISLSILASDLTVTGGTYDPNTGVATFTNNTGGTFTVTGFLTGMTDTFVTGGTYSAGTITFTNTSGGTFDVTGLTTGSTSTISGDYLPLSGGTVTGNTVFTQNISVTGGTGINWISGNTSTDLLRITQTGTGNAFVVEDSTNPDTTPFIINSAGTTNIGSTNVYTDSSNLAAKLQVSNGVFGGSLSGLVSSTTAIIQANTTNSLGLLAPNANISTLYFGTPSDIYGSIMQWQYTNKRLYFGTQSSNGQIRFTTDNSVERVIFDENGNVGIGTSTPSEKLNVSGNALISGNLTATTISATTYQNLPTDIFVSGGTYSAGTITFTNTSGGTFDVTGLTTGSTSAISGDYLPLSGGTVTGNTVFTENISVTGGTGINWVSGNTSTDLLRVTQTGTGNAFVVEDSTNPDNSPFVINSGGSVSIGSTDVFSVGGSAETKLNVANGSSGLAKTGLTVSTPLIVESSLITSIGMFSPDNQLSQIYFGTPSDPLGSVLRWDYTNKNFNLGTSTTSGKLIFLTGTYDEVARIDQNGNFGIGLTGATQKFEVSGNSRIIGSLSAQTGYISGSGQNILTVIGSGNSTTSPLFSVQGSSGELFSVSDSLVGSLFSVNDISGLPIIEVFSDNTTLWGSYQAPSLNTTVKTSAGTGSTTVYTIPQSAYTGAFFEYTVSSTSGARAGSIMSIFSGSSVQYTETTTNDIGSTTGLTFSVSADSTNAVLLASGTTDGWTIKTIVRSI